MVKCPQCPDRDFPNSQSLIDHQRFSTRWHPFCKTCDKSLSYSNRRSFEEHLRRHRDADAEFRCSTCSRGFATNRALDEHYRQSPNHPNCPIQSCGKGFRNKWACEEHVKQIHPTTEYPCGDRYFPEEREQHFQTPSHHTVCAICNGCFVDAGALLEHLNLAHQNSWCQRCKRQLSGRDELEQHYLTSFAHPTCEICRVGFADDDDFRQHIIAKHSPPKLTSFADVTPLNKGNLQVNTTAPGLTQDTGIPSPPEARTWRCNSRSSSVGISSPIVRSLWDSSSPVKNCARVWEDSGSAMKHDTEDSNMVSMVENLIGEEDSKDEVPVTLYDSARSPVVFTGPTKSLCLTTDFNKSTSCTVFDPFGPPTCSTPSPDTSSPLGLSALPTVSPLASTPSDITMLDGSGRLPKSTSFSTLSMMTFPSKDGRNSINSSPIPRRGSTSSVETRVESMDPGDCGTLTKMVTNDRWKLFDEAISALTPPVKHRSGSTSIDTQADTTLCSQSSPSESESLQLSATTTSPNLSSISFSTIDMLVMEQELEEPLPRQNLKVATRTVSSQPPRAESLVYCRLCGQDPCDDCTATLCGHLYCHRCITEHVMKTPQCPTCSTPILLYCLFRLHLF